MINHTTQLHNTKYLSPPILFSQRHLQFPVLCNKISTLRLIRGPQSGRRVHVMAVSKTRGIHTTDHNVTQFY